MTESEAKTKWCPMVRLVRTDDRAGTDERIELTSNRNESQWSGDGSWFANGNPGLDEMTSCIGSACMMWRSYHVPASHIDPNTSYETWGMGENHGYCGLAGKP